MPHIDDDDRIVLEHLGQVELADHCSMLWDKYFAIEKGHPDRTQVAVDYNIAASKYNKVAGMSIMTAITPSTVNTHIEEDDIVPATKLLNPEPVVKQKAEPMLKISGEYQSTTDPMPLTDEIKAILENADYSGADKIRKVYFINPARFNIADFVKYSGINRGRTVGCLQKLSKDE